MGNLLTVRQAAGSLLVVGISGYELTSLDRAWLRLVGPAGVILFKRNIADASQTCALLNETTALCRPHALRCVDVEGGTVNRLRDALASLPSAQDVAAAARNLGKPALAREHGELIGRAVKAFGFNTTLAPVLDLALPVAAEVMGSRTAGQTADQVTAYAEPFFEALSAQGIAGCGKHFPGLGGASGDTHLLTPAIHRTWNQLWSEDLLPYRVLHAQMPMIMVNHAAYPATASKGQPASVSSFWMTTVLRKRIGYRGILFSDDFEMGGILKFLPIEEAVIAAFRAGMDIVEICHSPELVLRAYEALISQAERSASFRKLLLERAAAVARKRMRIVGSNLSRPATSKQLALLRERILRFNAIIESQSASGTRSLTQVETT
jgi:beta-N-acetylhexosaminidase